MARVNPKARPHGNTNRVLLEPSGHGFAASRSKTEDELEQHEAEERESQARRRVDGGAGVSEALGKRRLRDGTRSQVDLGLYRRHDSPLRFAVDGDPVRAE